MSDALTYLQGETVGERRDVIARYYYQVAHGDPQSSPVAFAVLLDACAEQFVKTPKALAEAAARLDTAMAEAQKFERRLMEQMEKSNSSVIAEFKDESRNVRARWQETLGHARSAAEGASRAGLAVKPLLEEIGRIEMDLRSLRNDLATHRLGIADIANGLEYIRAIHRDSRNMVQNLTEREKFGLTAISFLAGIIVCGLLATLVPVVMGWIKITPLVSGS